MPPVWTDLGQAAALVQDGDLVALGGHTEGAPMALIRELIRQGRAFPFNCRRAVKTGLCPCQPCGVLSQAKERAASR